MITKSVLGLTNLEIREVIMKDVTANMDPTTLMDLFGDRVIFRGPYSTPGGDVWLEMDYGSGHVFHLSLKRYTRRTTMYARPVR